MKIVVQMQVAILTVSFLESEWNIASMSSVGEHLDETSVHDALLEMQASDARVGRCELKKRHQKRAQDDLLVACMWMRHRQFQQLVALMPLERMVEILRVECGGRRADVNCEIV